VRAEGGLTWSELNGAPPSTALAGHRRCDLDDRIAGLTLGGGLGWLMAKHGLAAEQPARVELVNAAGEGDDVTETSDPDLFWALRAQRRKLRHSRPRSRIGCTRWPWSPAD